jgi:hypothetical protein
LVSLPIPKNSMIRLFLCQLKVKRFLLLIRKVGI